MDWEVRPDPTERTDAIHFGSGPVFFVRRHVDGECAAECDFNRGRCLMNWRHPGGTVPWDPSCRDGDAYRMVRVGVGPWVQ
jgi:hypothetical protein